jgi:hypothetical protein
MITALASSCYSPEATHWLPPVDAGVDMASADAVPVPVPIDAPIDARPDAPPDAAPPPPVEVTISVMGPGSVTLVGSGICTKQCTLFAAYGQFATLQAKPNDPRNDFSGWTGAACSGQPATCTFFAVAPITVSAKFMKAD